MFQVTLEHGKTYKVEFDYEREKGETHCSVLYENDRQKAHGIAKCSSKDQFNKNTGRKVALTNAIKSFRKEARQQFWEGYFQARNGKKE